MFKKIKYKQFVLCLLYLLTFCSMTEKEGVSSGPTLVRSLGAYTTTISLNDARSTTVNYVIDWVSNNGIVVGTYRDDVFAPKTEPLTGSLTNQSFVFEVSLPTPVAGVKKIVISNTTRSIFLVDSFTFDFKDENDNSLEAATGSALTTTKIKPNQVLTPLLLGSFSGDVGGFTKTPCPTSLIHQTILLKENLTTGVITLSTYKGNTPITLAVTHTVNMHGFLQVIATDFPNTPTHNMVGNIVASGVVNGPLLIAAFEDQTNLCSWTLEAPWEEN